MKIKTQKFIFKVTESPTPAMAERPSLQETLRTETQDGLDNLRDTVETSRTDAASNRVASAVEKIGGWGNFFDQIGAALEKAGTSLGEGLKKVAAEFLKRFGLHADDLDVASPKLSAIETPEKEERKSESITEYVKNASTDFGVPSWAILSILRQETGGTFDTNAQNPFTSAKGLAQAVDRTWQGFLQAPDNPHFREQHQWKNPATGEFVDSRFNPEAAIYFVAWYIRRVGRDVNRKIDLKGRSEGYRAEWKIPEPAHIIPDNMATVGMAYHSGPEGYLRWRRYSETRNDAAKARLFAWQKRDVVEVRGKRWMSYEDEITRYQTNVSKFAKQYAQKT